MADNDKTMVEKEFARIDAMRSINDMLMSLHALEPTTCEAVILHGLANSKFRFTWSFAAVQLKIHEEKWPPQVM